MARHLNLILTKYEVWFIRATCSKFKGCSVLQYHKLKGDLIHHKANHKNVSSQI